MPPGASRYLDIAAELRERILGGEWEPGATMPRMSELARSRTDFGFRGGRYFKDDDGLSVAIYEFDDLDGLERFRRDPEHVAVQRRGAEFFEWMRNDVCVVERQDPMGSIPLDTTA